MAKIRKIYDDAIKPDGSKQVIYPVTSTRAVYTTSNVTLDKVLSEGYRFGGIVLPTDSPSITDQRVFYGASVPGVYTSFGNIAVDSGEAIFLLYDGEHWEKGIFGGAGYSTLTGFKALASIQDLPREETQFGYLINGHLYVWVGENGDTLDGLYLDCGELRGASAYEVAVRNGYRGTEQEWLNDPIHGIKGISVKSVECIHEALEDGGTNIWRITLTNGNSTDFEVKNGNQGNSGYQGAAGELEVVNNLTDGGATAALSAEMGKAIVDLYGTYVDNPEFVKVWLDKEDRILMAIRNDGDIYFGVGTPSQVKEYIDERIEALGLQDYEKLVHFVGELIDSPKTLSELFSDVYTTIDTKVDKEGGKSLIDSEYATTKSTIDSSEFLEVTTDSEDKVLEGIQVDGTKVVGGDLNVGGSTNINGDTKILGNIEISGVSYNVIENPEYLAAWVDAEDKVLFGLKTDGKTYVGDADFLNEIKNNHEDINEIKSYFDNLDIDALSSITAVENPEYIDAKTDSEGKLIAGRTTDGAAFENVGFSTPKMSIDGHAIENIEDPEGRIEITADSEGKVLSYRDADGMKHENVGIILTEDGVFNLKKQIDTNCKEQRFLPKFGKVNIKEETFYLTAVHGNNGWDTKDDVVCIQMLDDTNANANQRKTLSYYYIKSTLTPLAGGGYDRTSVNENSVQLQLFGGKDVVESNSQYFVKEITKVYGEYYLTSSLVKTNGVYSIYYIYGIPCSMKVDYTDDNPDQTTLSNAIEVGKVTDVPPIKAWAVNKMIEHYCVADIDFGDFYTKNNIPVGIKYQGSGTTGIRKRGFRLTFYKNNDYAKKNKIKIGEMVRLSGFNLKSFGVDKTRVKDPILSNTFIEMWETRGKDAYPWNANNCIYNGATGFIKSFPIELQFDSDFYGLYFFGLKKDEKNYMLDGTDESGIFVSGSNNSLSASFENATHSDCEDEMMDEMSQSTADALDEFFKYCKGFTEGTIEIDGQVVDFTNDMLEERIDINNWIDYWIGLEVFQLYDNTFHNCVMYSGADKIKFSLFFYDLDDALEYPADSSVIDIVDNIGWRTQFWKKFINEYKDYIINRYANLRKNVLSIDNIYAIYKNYTNGIPTGVIQKEVLKWGTGNVETFTEILDLLDSRLSYLDQNYFNIELN